MLLNYFFNNLNKLRLQRDELKKAKQKVKETHVGLQSLSNICVVCEGNLKC